ncbi:MAG TPA: hypothetical protein VKP58_06690 [Candidatus Acidoferrum sp.]|nr:hypothetical protein [Candidatus Acidoferrum sp.]
MRLRQIVLLASAITAITFIVFPVALAQEKNAQADGQKESLRKFLQVYVQSQDYDYKSTRFIAAFSDLKDDGVQRAFVYFNDPDSCGSGGCSALLLEPQGATFRKIASFTVVRLPIRVLAAKSNGWHDLAVRVAGGGIQPGSEAILSFNGKTYPRNPSAPPARPSNGTEPGSILIPEAAKAEPLFP